MDIDAINSGEDSGDEEEDLVANEEDYEFAINIVETCCAIQCLVLLSPR